MHSQESALVGREREQQQLGDLLTAACSGQGRLVLISGEAGIGKTTLVRDLVGRARQQGALVLSGACYDLTTTPPYGPWAEAIRGYRPSGSQPLPPVWFGNPDELAKIGSQQALFEEARAFFSSVASQQPLLVVLEDLHWADPASIEALRYLARSLHEAPVLIAATYRGDEMAAGSPMFETIPMLIREAGAERVELRRWREPDTRQLIAGQYWLSVIDVQRASGYVQRLAGGNPFFTLELLRTLEVDGVLHRDGGGWTLGQIAGPQVPPLVRQVIERRLKRLSSATQEVLETGSVIGYAVAFDLWQAVGGTDDERLVAAIDEALSAQLIDELPDRSGIQFRHALVRETLYAGINPLRLRRLHLRAAEALIERPAPDPDAVAHHLGQAGDSRQLDWLVQAGDRAESSYALVTAAERFEQATALLEGDDDQLIDRGWLLFRISSLLRWTGLPRALECAEEAIRIGQQAGDRWLETIAGFDRAFHLFIRGGDHYPEAMEVSVARCRDFDRLLRASGDIDCDPGWQRLLTLRPFVASMRNLALKTDPQTTPYVTDMWGAAASVLCEAGRLAEARDICEHLRPLAESAIRDAPTNSHSVGYGDLLNVLGRIHAYTGRPGDSADCFEKALDYYKDHRHFIMVVNNNDLDLDLRSLTYDTENRAAQHAMAAEIATYTLRGGDGVPPERHVSPAVMRLRIIEGRWQEARDIARADGHNARFRERKNSLLALLDWHQGRFERLRERIAETLPAGSETQPGTPQFMATLELQRLAALLALAEGDRELATRWLGANERWLARTGAVTGRAEHQLVLAQLHLDDGDVPAARRAASRVVDEASDPRQPLALLAGHRLLGELDTRERRIEDAGKRLASALELAERCQAPYEIALVRLALSELAGATRDLPRARDLLGQARETFERLEARPALERAARLDAALSGLARDYPSGLTAREVEVLCLTAEGLSNKEIADRLYLSVRTVERHLTNIYRKIDATNRVEAGAFVERHGLTALLAT